MILCKLLLWPGIPWKPWTWKIRTHVLHLLPQLSYGPEKSLLSGLLVYGGFITASSMLSFIENYLLNI